MTFRCLELLSLVSAASPFTSCALSLPTSHAAARILVEDGQRHRQRLTDRRVAAHSIGKWVPPANLVLVGTRRAVVDAT